MAANDVVQSNPPVLEQNEVPSNSAVQPPSQKLFGCAYDGSDASAASGAAKRCSTADSKLVPPVDLFQSERNAIPTNKADQDDRNHFQQLEGQLLRQLNRTVPVAKGEGYYQVLERMHKDWSAEHLYNQAHRIKTINHNSDELKVGQRLSLLSDRDTDSAVKERMDAYDKATPEKRKLMIEEVRKQIHPDKPISHGHEHRHEHRHEQGHKTQIS